MIRRGARLGSGLHLPGLCVPASVAGGGAGGIDPADTFDRADNASTMGTSSSGHTWTVHSGTWGIQTQRAYSPASGFASIDFGVGKTNHIVEATIVVRDAQQSGVTARLVDANNCYIAMNLTDGFTYLFRRNAGAFNQIGSAVAGGANGDVIALSCVGTAIKVIRNSIEIISATDGTLTTGTRGGLTTLSNTARFDNFSIHTAA